MTKAKPAPLSTANTPNDIDPTTIARLAELDRTDPIDIAILSSDGTAQTFDGVGFTDVPPHPDAPHEEHAAWAEALTANRIELSGVGTEDPDLATFLNRHTATEETHASNPYLLESSTVLNDLRYEAQRAQLLINAIDHEIEHLNTDADFQIRRIETRRKLEIDQRTARKDDLQRIVDAAALLDGKDPSE